MKTLGTILVGLVLAVGCADMGPVDDSSDLGKADGFDSREGTTGEFFVYENGVQCVVAPCPAFTVITRGGNRIDVANVELTNGRPAPGKSVVEKGGAIVEGTIVPGSWDVGAEGTRLVINRTVQNARQYMVWQNVERGDTGFTALEEDGSIHDVSRVNVDGLTPDPDGTTPSMSGLVQGNWATKGFLAQTDTGERVLFSTASAGHSMPCAVQPSSVQCITGPCPKWDLFDIHGAPMGTAADINLSYMRLSFEDELALYQRLYEGGGQVFGWMAQDSWTPGSRGDVVFVVALED